MTGNSTTTTTTSHPPLETRGPVILRTSIALCVVCALLVAFRKYMLFARRDRFSADDGFVLASLALMIVSVVIAALAVHNGFGWHSKDIPKMHGNKIHALFYFYLFQITYKEVIMCNKLAFLSLYLRIFPAKRIRMVCWATVAFVAAGTTAMVLVTIMQCMPVQKNWNKSIKGHCVNNSAFRWSWASYNTATDLWIILLPMPIIFRLQLSLLKRIGTAIIFALGLFINVASIIRMIELVQSVTATDPTWQSAPAFLWTVIEMCVGLIAICLPSLRKPIQSLLPKRWGGTTGNTAPQGYRLGNLSGPGETGNTTTGKGAHEVYITSKYNTDESEDRESQERILAPGITVQKEVHVRHGQPGDI